MKRHSGHSRRRGSSDDEDDDLAALKAAALKSMVVSKKPKLDREQCEPVKTDSNQSLAEVAPSPGIPWLPRMTSSVEQAPQVAPAPLAVPQVVPQPWGQAPLTGLPPVSIYQAPSAAPPITSLPPPAQQAFPPLPQTLPGMPPLFPPGSTTLLPGLQPPPQTLQTLPLIPPGSASDPRATLLLPGPLPALQTTQLAPIQTQRFPLPQASGLPPSGIQTLMHLPPPVNANPLVPPNLVGSNMMTGTVPQTLPQNFTPRVQVGVPPQPLGLPLNIPSTNLPDMRMPPPGSLVARLPFPQVAPSIEAHQVPRPVHHQELQQPIQLLPPLFPGSELAVGPHRGAPPGYAAQGHPPQGHPPPRVDGPRYYPPQGPPPQGGNQFHRFPPPRYNMREMGPRAQPAFRHQNSSMAPRTGVVRPMNQTFQQPPHSEPQNASFNQSNLIAIQTERKPDSVGSTDSQAPRPNDASGRNLNTGSGKQGYQGNDRRNQGDNSKGSEGSTVRQGGGAADKFVLQRPQDKWAGPVGGASASSTNESTTKMKNKFNRYDDDSDDDEDDDEDDDDEHDDDDDVSSRKRKDSNGSSAGNSRRRSSHSISEISLDFAADNLDISQSIEDSNVAEEVHVKIDSTEDQQVSDSSSDSSLSISSRRTSNTAAQENKISQDVSDSKNNTLDNSAKPDVITSDKSTVEVAREDASVAAVEPQQRGKRRVRGKRVEQVSALLDDEISAAGDRKIDSLKSTLHKVSSTPAMLSLATANPDKSIQSSNKAVASSAKTSNTVAKAKTSKSDTKMGISIKERNAANTKALIKSNLKSVSTTSGAVTNTALQAANRNVTVSTAETSKVVPMSTSISSTNPVSKNIPVTKSLSGLSVTPSATTLVQKSANKTADVVNVVPSINTEIVSNVKMSEAAIKNKTVPTTIKLEKSTNSNIVPTSVKVEGNVKNVQSNVKIEAEIKTEAANTSKKPEVAVTCIKPAVTNTIKPEPCKDDDDDYISSSSDEENSGSSSSDDDGSSSSDDDSSGSGSSSSSSDAESVNGSKHSSNNSSSSNKIGSLAENASHSSADEFSDEEKQEDVSQRSESTDKSDRGSVSSARPLEGEGVRSRERESQENCDARPVHGRSSREPSDRERFQGSIRYESRLPEDERRRNDDRITGRRNYSPVQKRYDEADNRNERRRETTRDDREGRGGGRVQYGRRSVSPRYRGNMSPNRGMERRREGSWNRESRGEEDNWQQRQSGPRARRSYDEYDYRYPQDDRMGLEQDRRQGLDDRRERFPVRREDWKREGSFDRNQRNFDRQQQQLDRSERIDRNERADRNFPNRNESRFERRDGDRPGQTKRQSPDGGDFNRDRYHDQRCSSVENLSRRDGRSNYVDDSEKNRDEWVQDSRVYRRDAGQNRDRNLRDDRINSPNRSWERNSRDDSHERNMNRSDDLSNRERQNLSDRNRSQRINDRGLNYESRQNENFNRDNENRRTDRSNLKDGDSGISFEQRARENRSQNYSRSQSPGDFDNRDQQRNSENDYTRERIQRLDRFSDRNTNERYTDRNTVRSARGSVNQVRARGDRGRFPERPYNRSDRNMEDFSTETSEDEVRPLVENLEEIRSGRQTSMQGDKLEKEEISENRRKRSANSGERPEKRFKSQCTVVKSALHIDRGEVKEKAKESKSTGAIPEHTESLNVDNKKVKDKKSSKTDLTGKKKSSKKKKKSDSKKSKEKLKQKSPSPSADRVTPTIEESQVGNRSPSNELSPIREPSSASFTRENREQDSGRVVMQDSRVVMGSGSDLAGKRERGLKRRGQNSIWGKHTTASRDNPQQQKQQQQHVQHEQHEQQYSDDDSSQSPPPQSTDEAPPPSSTRLPVHLRLGLVKPVNPPVEVKQPVSSTLERRIYNVEEPRKSDLRSRLGNRGLDGYDEEGAGSWGRNRRGGRGGRQGNNRMQRHDDHHEFESF